MVSSIFFTAIVFESPRWEEKELHNLYKQFLRAYATTTESICHKVNSDILVTPKHAEDIGLAADSVAIKTQLTKRVIARLV